MLDYTDLLDVFWVSHDPRGHAPSRQYRSAIFYRTEEERIAAEVSKARVEARVGPVETAIEPFEHFYRAEDYHQKHRLRQRPDLVGSLLEIAGSDRAMVDSTAAARINGWLGGDITAEDIIEWLPMPLGGRSGT